MRDVMPAGKRSLGKAGGESVEVAIMIYYDDGRILIRNMEKEDAPQFRDGEVAQGWLNSDIKKYEMRLVSRKSGSAYSGISWGYRRIHKRISGCRRGRFRGNGIS